VTTTGRALALIAVYVGLSLLLSNAGVPKWITCIGVFALYFVWFGARAHLFTLVTIFGMYGLVLSIPRPEPWLDATWFVLADDSPFSLRVLLFLIVPMIFFTTVVNPYQLARDVARLRIPALGPVLQLVGSIRLALFNRLQEIETHLAVRGIPASSGITRLTTARLWAVPLVASLISEAANRPAYCEMLGLPFPPKLPASRAALAPADLALIALAGALLVTWRFTS
jgi:hypothetical protein